MPRQQATFEGIVHSELLDGFDIANFQKRKPKPCSWKQFALIFASALAVVVGIFLPIVTGILRIAESVFELNDLRVEADFFPTSAPPLSLLTSQILH